MAVTTDILATYRRPGRVVARLLQGPEHEARALLYLMLACGLIFVGQWPRLARAAFEVPEIPLDVRLGGALLAWGCMAPLVFYVFALLAHLVARALGGRGSGYSARIALFWSLLAAAPLWMLHGLAAGMIGPGPGLTVLGILGLGVTIVFIILALRQAEWTSPSIAETSKLA